MPLQQCEWFAFQSGLKAVGQRFASDCHGVLESSELGRHLKRPIKDGEASRQRQTADLNPKLEN